MYLQGHKYSNYVRNIVQVADKMRLTFIYSSLAGLPNATSHNRLRGSDSIMLPDHRFLSHGISTLLPRFRKSSSGF